MSAWPLESDATVAVDAAARATFEAHMAENRKVLPEQKFPEWDDLDATVKLSVREAVLPTVWAALSALPDPRKAAWMEGYIAADNGLDEGTSPY